MYYHMVGRTTSFISPFYSLLRGLKLIKTALHIKVCIDLNYWGITLHLCVQQREVKGVDPDINVLKIQLGMESILKLSK